MITTKMAPCISVIYDICSCKSHLAVVVVIIWWCDLQLHMSYITEIQVAVVFVIIWWCELQLPMSCITETYDHDHDGGYMYFSNT
jgi:predicted secreted protein